MAPVPRKEHANALYHTAMRKLEIDLIRWYLRNAGWSYAKLAKALGVPRNYIYRRMKILGLDPAVEARRPKPEADDEAESVDDEPAEFSASERDHGN
jgi:Zn-dependent peptidase ImmA (M78 family)